MSWSESGGETAEYCNTHPPPNTVVHLASMSLSGRLVVGSASCGHRSGKRDHREDSDVPEYTLRLKGRDCFFSCERFPYSLLRRWNNAIDDAPYIDFIMLNLGIADAQRHDPTFERCSKMDRVGSTNFSS